MWCILYGNKLTVQTGRDGFLKVAKRDTTFDYIQSSDVREGDAELDVVFGSGGGGCPGIEKGVIHVADGLRARRSPPSCNAGEGGGRLPDGIATAAGIDLADGANASAR